jgi:glycosyltransferase involved in cell wall biosynthesis
VDTHRFRPDAQTRAQLRAEMKIPDEAVVLLYLGRLSVEKGVLDLAHAFTQSCQSRCNAHLMIVGPDEENLAAKILDICSTMRHFVHLQSYTETPERFMAAADVFCLPSYREGFGNVIIEAACVGIPAIGSRIYGITDAIVEGQTGLLHTVGDRDDLARSITRLMEHGDLRLDLGRNAQLRAARLFNKDMLTCALLDFYRSL